MQQPMSDGEVIGSNQGYPLPRICRGGSQRPNGYRTATRGKMARNGYRRFFGKLLFLMELADGFEPTTC